MSVASLAGYVAGGRAALAALGRADALGVALQLTNILRDLREDLHTGRIYLPSDDLRRFGIDLMLDAEGTLSIPDERLSALVNHQAARARAWFATGARLLLLLDRRSAACCAAMAGIYPRLLDQPCADPAAIAHGRVSLPTRREVAVAGRSIMRGRL